MYRIIISEIEDILSFHMSHPLPVTGIPGIEADLFKKTVESVVNSMEKDGSGCIHFDNLFPERTLDIFYGGKNDNHIKMLAELKSPGILNSLGSSFALGYKIVCNIYKNYSSIDFIENQCVLIIIDKYE